MSRKLAENLNSKIASKDANNSNRSLHFEIHNNVNCILNERFIDNDVIMVMANYRLGPLGFFAMGENRGVPGNAGLWDQNEALKWVYQHVRNFGGDPLQVTIFGESAGSLSVGLHFISPRSNGDHGYSKGRVGYKR